MSSVEKVDIIVKQSYKYINKLLYMGFYQDMFCVDCSSCC